MNTINRAIELKESGLTTKEVIEQLIKEGRTMPNGDPITRARIYKWVKGVNSQVGRRNPSMQDEITKLKIDSIRLKQSGLTIKEVVEQLISEGRTMPNGDPITRFKIYKWVKGVNPQGGRRNPSMKGMTKEEREEYFKDSKERSKAYQREWRLKNKEYLRSWNRRWYEENRLTVRRKLR